jgi:hypothetical protein
VNAWFGVKTVRRGLADVIRSRGSVPVTRDLTRNITPPSRIAVRVIAAIRSFKFI